MKFHTTPWFWFFMVYLNIVVPIYYAQWDRISKEYKRHTGKDL